MKLFKDQTKDEQKNIEENFIDLDEEIEEIVNGSIKNIKTVSDLREKIMDELNELNSTAIERFSSIETLVHYFDEGLKTQKDELKTQKNLLEIQMNELETQKDGRMLWSFPQNTH